MDLEIHEELALAADRARALAKLLPGSEDHDYYRCLDAQHRGALDEAEPILEDWPARHGHTERHTRLRLRQLLLRANGGMTPAVADGIRDWFGVSHWHEAEVEEVAPTRPTRLADDAFSGSGLLEQAVANDSTLRQVSDEGLLELIAAPTPLDASRRRALLSRLHHCGQPELVALIAEELTTRGAGEFGSLAVHDQLTLDQLHQLAVRRPELRGHLGWVTACVQRMRPHDAIDLDIDRTLRANYLEHLWRFIAPLPAAINTLKGHVLYHMLETGLQLARPLDRELFARYLALPRTAGYLRREWIERVRREEVAQLHSDLRTVTGLPAAGDDEALVRTLVHADRAHAERYAEWLDRAWLDRELAIATLLDGAAGSERATITLGPARAAELRDRIELAWCPHNPTQLAADQPIALDVDLKNAGTVVVKVFRVDPLAYFHRHQREVATDLDLDGLAASHEFTITGDDAPIRRVRRRIELAMCRRPGTYIIDLIGNGMASRALVVKGRLRHVVRVGAAGHVVTIVDEQGNVQPTARAWIGSREYVADADGSFVVPFSTAPQRTAMLLSCGDTATVAELELQRESYQLAVDILLDREALAAGRTVRAVARVALQVAGAPASLALIKNATWDVTVVDRQGIATTKSHPLALVDYQAAVIEWSLPDDVARVGLAIRGTVEVRSEQREHSLAETRWFEVATIHNTAEIEALYLARTVSGWVVSAMGKTGEPRAARPVTITVMHRWSRVQLAAELATDGSGRVELGALPGAEWISATLGSLTQQWFVGESGLGMLITGREHTDVVIALPLGRAFDEVMRRWSLVELRGGVPALAPVHEVSGCLGGIIIRGLVAGHYSLRAPGIHATIVIAPVGAMVDGFVVAADETIEVSPPLPIVESVELASTSSPPETADRPRAIVRVRGARSHTRVHLIASRHASALVEPTRLGPARSAKRRVERARQLGFVSNRELGDEYRYVLDRKRQRRFPNLLVDKPSLLLNPWSRRATTTEVAVARERDGYTRSLAQRMGAPPPAAPSVRGQASDAAYASYDFLPPGDRTIANLIPDRDGVIAIPRELLAGAMSLTIIVDDPTGTTAARAHFAESPLAPRDLRLRLALDSERHASQRKEIAPLTADQQLVIEDLATARVHLVDSVASAHRYLLALGDDPTLREFGFITRWQDIADGERRELYSKYACHELHLFLFHKDREFFTRVIAPYLANKRIKTFVDHWLLGHDLAGYLEPARLARLNAVELALLAQRLPPDHPIVRVLGDPVAIAPPDPNGDTRLIDTMLGAASLDRDGALAEHQRTATELAGRAAPMAPMAMSAGYAPAQEMSSDELSVAAPRRPHTVAKKERAADFEVEEGTGTLGADLARRTDAAPHYRAADKTQEWAENNWWKRTPDDSDADMITANRLWRDLAVHRSDRGPFLSRWLGLATGSFAEAMCALAVIDLPLVAATSDMAADGPRLTITAHANLLAASSQLVDGELVGGGAPLVVGMSYVRRDDRYEWDSGEQRDKYVEGAFAIGVVYTCQVVLANPTSTRQRIAALVQIPRGSIAVASGHQTQTLELALEPYATHGHEVSFYFPSPGRWSHFPVHVSRGGAIVAAAPPRQLEVTPATAVFDPKSWSSVSQRGRLDELVGFLATANLAAIDLERIAWRMRDRAAYDAIVDALERRHVYSESLWGYALLHRDLPRARTWLRALGDRALQAGPVLEPLGIDSEQLGHYEHLELSPLINARAHRLGGKLRILNDGLAAQYTRFLDQVAHRRTATDEDLLAAASYLIAQDRIDDATAMLARVDRNKLADRMQHDYLAAYLAATAGDVARARELVAPWRDHLVDRWRFRFAALAAVVDDSPPDHAIDPRSRDHQHAQLAARQPAFDIALDRDGIAISSQNVGELELRFFELDIELMFSRGPFVASDVSRFSFIEPGHRQPVHNPVSEHRVPWPDPLRGKNVVVEAVGHGLRAAKVHYANDLTTTIANQAGQLRVQRTSDRSSLATTYVKVYARKRGGEVAFYKDGYTDLRGWFDYATLSTNDLDTVDRFAILIHSDEAGATILETPPPMR